MKQPHAGDTAQRLEETGCPDSSNKCPSSGVIRMDSENSHLPQSRILSASQLPRQVQVKNPKDPKPRGICYLWNSTHTAGAKGRLVGSIARREDFSHQFLEEFTHPSTQLRNNIAHMPTTLRADYKARKADLYKSTQHHLAWNHPTLAIKKRNVSKCEVQSRSSTMRWATGRSRLKRDRAGLAWVLQPQRGCPVSCPPHLQDSSSPAPEPPWSQLCGRRGQLSSGGEGRRCRRAGTHPRRPPTLKQQTDRQVGFILSCLSASSSQFSAPGRTPVL